MHILLLQFRPDPAMAAHEFDLIVKFSGRSPADFVRVDTAEQSLGISLLDGVDALMLGGSGDYLISRGDIPDIRAALKPFLAEARKRRVPTLGICFGGQLMTEAFGGAVELDEARAETGTFPVTKTPEAVADPLFAPLPATFEAQLGHKDFFTRLPEGAVRLAFSERSENQAWVFPGEPMYALTFHPELDMDAVLYRLDYYAKEYKLTPEAIEEKRRVLKPSPEASTLLVRFLNTFVAGKV